MENQKKPLSTKQRILYIAISLFLVMLLSSLVNRTANEKQGGTDSWELSELSADGAEFSSEKFIVTSDEGATLTLEMNGKYGGVLRFYGSELSTDTVECVYSTADDDDFEAKGILTEDGSLAFRLYSPNDERVTVTLAKGVSVSEITMTPSFGFDFGYELNVRALVILIVFLTLLVLAEKKTGFIFNTGSTLKRMITSLTPSRENSGRRASILRIVSAVSIIVYIVAAWADFVAIITAPWYTVVLSLFALFAAFGVIVLECTHLSAPSVPRAFLALALVIGSFIALSEPVSTQVAWDDGYHFANSAYVPAFINEWRLPLSVSELARERFLYATYSAHPDEVLGVILSEFSETAPLDFSMSEILEGFRWYYVFGILVLPFVLVYLIFDYVAYIPAWIFLTIFGAVGADVAKLLVFGRLVNLLCYAILVFFAIRRLKSGKYIFAAVGLIPVFLFLGASYSTDWWINGAMTLGLAYLIGGMQRDEIFKRRDLCVIIGFMAFACGPKQIYFIMMAPLLFLPRRKFKSKRSMILTKIAVAFVMLAILLTFALPMIANPDSRTDSRGGADVSSSGQISYILSHPFEYTGTLLNYMQSYLSLGFGSEHLTLFAWLDSGYAVFSLLVVLVLLFVTFTDRGESDLFRGAGAFRALNLVASFLAVVLVVTSLYVAFTPVGSRWVNGCQYRYIFPILPITLWCLGSHRVKKLMSERAMTATVFSISSVAAIGSFVTALLI